MLFDDFKIESQEFFIYIEYEKNLSTHTQRAYKNDISQFIEFWQSILNDEITIKLNTAIEKYLVYLFHKKLNKSTVARRISCFQSLSHFLEKKNIDCSIKIKRPKIDKKLPVFLNVQEMLHLLDNISENDLPSKKPFRDKAILELLYATGIRCSELCDIKLEDIDMENKLIKIKGKGRIERIALFGNKALEKIKLYMHHERNRITESCESLFVSYKNEKLNPRSIQRIIKMFRSFLKIDRAISPHKIRHSFATHLLNQGVDLRVIQELLGHKTISSTEKYTHVCLDSLKDIFKTMHPLNKKEIE